MHASPRGYASSPSRFHRRPSDPGSSNRTSLPKVGACGLFLLLAVGCSNVLGFDEVAFTPGAEGEAGAGGTTSDPAVGGSGGAVGSLGAPGSAGDAGAVGTGGGAGSLGAGGTDGSGGSTSNTAGSGGSTSNTAGSGGSASNTAGSGGTTATGGSGGTNAAGGSGSPPVDPPALDLSTVTWLHPNVSGWPVTVNLASVTFSGSQICLNHDIASKNWPIRQISGTDVVANPWVFIYHDNRWYGATWEWLRPPGQTCKNQSSVAGDHIKTSPFDAASNWKPRSGETIYFMVSGLARGSQSNVQERSNVVKVVWP